MMHTPHAISEIEGIQHKYGTETFIDAAGNSFGSQPGSPRIWTSNGFELFTSIAAVNNGFHLVWTRGPLLYPRCQIN